MSFITGELNEDVEAVKAFRVWTPIGNDGNNAYYGTFEGNGKTISGLYFNDGNVSYVGLIGWASFDPTGSVIVRNVSVADSYFHGNYNVGGVVASINGTITNCHNAAYVSGTTFVGGIVGVGKAAVTNCYNTGTVKAEIGYLGGVIGQYYRGTVENCYNIGSVIGGVNYIGGIMGNGTATNCYYLDSSCTSAGGGTAKTAEEFASGEVAFLLGDAYGQAIGIESYPVLGGIKVISENDTYKNQITEFEIISLGEDKKSANVAIPTKGNYTLILADYEENRLNKLDTVTVTAESDNTIVTATSGIDITLGAGDKIMLLQDMKNLVPMCEAYIIK